jgi:hypothetical protein
MACDLDGRRGHASRSARDQHALPRLHAGTSHERVPCRHEHQARRRRGLERDGVRDFHQVGGRDDGVFGEPTLRMLADEPEWWPGQRPVGILPIVPLVAERRVGDHPRTDRDRLGSGPHGAHLAGQIRSPDVGHGDLDGKPAAGPQVEMVERCGPHTDLHFARAGFGRRHLHDVEDVGTSVLREDRGFHDRSVRWWKAARAIARRPTLPETAVR